MLYLITLYVHAGAMVAAGSFLLTGEALLAIVASGRVALARTASRLGRASGALIGVGMASGVALTVMGGWPLQTPWLMSSLVLLAALVATEHGLVRKWNARFAVALAASDGDALVRLTREPRARIGRALMLVLFAAIAALMVAKPTFMGFA